MVLSLVPAVFAADEPTITMSADKTSVAPGETVTLTLSLDKELVADAVGISISFDTNAYTLTGRKILEVDLPVSALRILIPPINRAQ